MMIDIDDQPPVKLRLYRIPIHKRELVEQPIQEITERLQLPWSFPIVINKDRGHRFCVNLQVLHKTTGPCVLKDSG